MLTNNPMLSLFKEQLVAECGELVSRRGLKNQGQGLIWWYFTRLRGLSEIDVEEIVCDGGGDLGIDAIWIDDEELVHFYQFKDPESLEKGFGAGEVDRFLAGLRVIFTRNHRTIANGELRDRIEEILQRVPSGYRLHLISSAGGLPVEAEVKLKAFVEEMSISSAPNFFQWAEEPLHFLQDKFYQQKLPAVSDPVSFELAINPYVVRAAAADSYFFHAEGKTLADLYGQHGELLLQRNIRVDQGSTATNRSIEATGSGPDSANFLHFNNGVTFLCDVANFDFVRRVLTLTKAQVVNGGQTIRALHRMNQRKSLKGDVVVPVRAITSQGDKEFGSNVAVNQNNQNQMSTGFLRSNDPRIVQLSHSLASLGWYLERREGELEAATSTERAALEHKIGRPLEGHVITLKEGLQAYVSTFFEQPELAKKNARKMFLSPQDGGYFETIFSPNRSTGEILTAEKFVVAHEIKTFADDFIKQFAAKKRRKDRAADWKADYKTLLGAPIVDIYGDKVDQVVPQSSVFLCATIYQDFVKIGGGEPKELPAYLGTSGADLIRELLFNLLIFAEKNPKLANKSWPTLLKSSTFFSSFVTYLQGLRAGSAGVPKA